MRLLLPTLAAAAALLPAAPAAASCVAMGPTEQEARAEVIVEGRVLDAAPGEARLAVTRVLEGDVPAEVAVRGAGGPGVTSSVDIDPRPGERWRILGARAGPGAIATSVCAGSRRLDGPARDAPDLAAATDRPAPGVGGGDPRPGSAGGLGVLLAWLGALLGLLP